jgi:hypothetical protein
MTIITLPPEIEGPLAEAAKRQGTSPELLAIETLRRQFHAAPKPPAAENGAEGETLYDFLKGFIGTVDGTTEPLSENTGRRFTEMLQEKRQQETS